MLNSKCKNFLAIVGAISLAAIAVKAAFVLSAKQDVVSQDLKESNNSDWKPHHSERNDDVCNTKSTPPLSTSETTDCLDCADESDTLHSSCEAFSHNNQTFRPDWNAHPVPPKDYLNEVFHSYLGPGKV